MSTHNESEIDCDFTDDVVCPHCGYAHTDDLDELFRNDDSARLHCDSCGLEFEVERNVSVRYSSSKIDHEAEARKKAEDDQQRAEQLDKCRRFLPGTPVRVVGGPRAGKEGVVANREVGPYVWIVDERGGHIASAAPEHVQVIR